MGLLGGSIMCHLIQNSSFCGGVGACAASILSKDFEILDLDPPNKPTSHYDTCHFGYNLASRNLFNILNGGNMDPFKYSRRNTAHPDTLVSFAARDFTTRALC